MKGHKFKIWSKEDLKLVKDYYESERSDILAKRLNCSIRALYHKAGKLGLKKDITEERNSMWKGNKVGYGGLHRWVRENKSKPEFCEKCEVNPPHDLANISGMYRRDIKDFEWLCRKCHMEKDGRVSNLIPIQKGKSFNEIYGNEKASEIKSKIGLAIKKVWENDETRRETLRLRMVGNQLARVTPEEFTIYKGER